MTQLARSHLQWVGLRRVRAVLLLLLPPSLLCELPQPPSVACTRIWPRLVSAIVANACLI